MAVLWVLRATPPVDVHVNAATRGVVPHVLHVLFNSPKTSTVQHARRMQTEPIRTVSLPRSLHHQRSAQSPETAMAMPSASDLMQPRRNVTASAAIHGKESTASVALLGSRNVRTAHAAPPKMHRIHSVEVQPRRPLHHHQATSAAKAAAPTALYALKASRTVPASARTSGKGQCVTSAPFSTTRRHVHRAPMVIPTTPRVMHT